MFRKNITLSLVLALTFALSACSSSTSSSQSKTSGSSQQTITDKLGIGILKMEGTTLAVTAAQSSILLPLWKAVNVMGNDKEASQVEVAALYVQIQGTLTPDQVTSIQKLTYTQEELSGFVTKYGSTSSSTSTSSSSSSASTTTQSNASGSSDMGGGGGGAPGGDSDITGVSSSSAQTSSTSSVAKVSSTKTSSNTDLNPTFASAIIKILEQHISPLE